MPQFINPYTDFGFKKIFGTASNKDLLIDFLNQLLPIQHQIASINILSSDVNGYDLTPVTSLLIKCTAHTGESFRIEFQKPRAKSFLEKSILHLSTSLHSQNGKITAESSMEHFYLISLLDFEFNPSKHMDFRKDISLKDQHGQEVFHKLQIRMIQMPLFNKSSVELENHLDKWCYFIKNVIHFDHVPDVLNEEIFQKAFAELSTSNMTQAQRHAYSLSLNQYKNQRSSGPLVLEEALDLLKIEIAKKMLLRGTPAEIVAADTGLSYQTVENLN